MSPHMHPILALLLQILASLILVCAMIWSGFALWYQFPSTEFVKAIIIVIFLGLGGLAFWHLWSSDASWRALLIFSLAFFVLIGWWSTIKPSNSRVWADDTAKMVHAHINGNLVTLTNVRNFNWKSDTQYVPRWETRQYDLNQLVSSDLILSYWMGPKIAHTLVSFGFKDRNNYISHVVFSLEIRKEHNESFSAIGGFFREFETIMIAADERDIVRVRSNVRGEQVYLYRLNVPQQDLRLMFLNYANEANQLANKPIFYNTLTSNCTTIVYDLAKRIKPSLPLDYRLILSGYLDEYVYDLGLLTPSYNIQTLKERGHINKRAIAADNDPQFSALIREGIPGINDQPK
jgi:hypothetical protein